ncbi:hypothetical protein D3C73_968060 [compost metagenome]
MSWSAISASVEPPVTATVSSERSTPSNALAPARPSSRLVNGDVSQSPGTTITLFRPYVVRIFSSRSSRPNRLLAIGSSRSSSLRPASLTRMPTLSISMSPCDFRRSVSARSTRSVISSEAASVLRPIISDSMI